MGTVIHAEYLGDDRVGLAHPTGDRLITDLPPDNGGKGRSFSPTDLVAGALASCVMTIMGVAARKTGLDITGTSITIEKRMQANPRRIDQLLAKVTFPKHLTQREKRKMLHCVKICPVHHSLHPDIDIVFQETQEEPRCAAARSA